MAVVELRNVSKIYAGGVHAVRHVDLTVPDREFVVLVGPSGCGKTTLLRMIAGLENVTSGEVRIGSRVVNDVDPKDRDIAMVFQSYALYPHMSVFENMALGLKLRRVSRAQVQQRVRDAAEILRIASLLERKPKQLSGGQRQRVALGRAMVRNPQVFLFDEPLSNLDAQMRVQTRAELTELQRRLQATILHVTHDQVEAMTLGHHVAVMREGAIQQVGRPLEVYRAPANRFVAEFIGSPPMNFLRGELTEGTSFRGAEGAVLHLDAGHSLPLHLGEEVDLGVRPEEVIPGERPPGPGHVGRCTGLVTFVESLGSETRVHVALGGGVAWVARVRRDYAVTLGEPLQLWVDLAGVHVFGPRNGLPYPRGRQVAAGG
jgi:multiple sugar transport system ATP-binding protein